MKFLKIIFIGILLLLTNTICQSKLPIVFSDKENMMNIGNSLQIMEDKTNRLSVSEVLNMTGFSESHQDVPNLGVSKSSYWIKFQLVNQTVEQKLILELQQPLMDEAELYSISKNGNFIKQRIAEDLPFYKRRYKQPNYLFELNIVPNDTAFYLMKVKSGEQILLPMKIGTCEKILEELDTKDLIFGLYAGIILVMFFYNLFIYLTTLDKSYLYYIIYTACVGLTQANLLGYCFKYLWPDFTWLANQSSYLLPALVGFALTLFVISFLQTKKYTPRLHKGLFILTGIYVLCILLAFAGLYDVSYKLVQLDGMATALYLIFIAIIIAGKGYKPAKFFLLAWFIFLTGVCFFAMKDFGILPYNTFTIYTMPAGSAFEVMLLSFALADRINVLKKEKEASQTQALVALQENERIITEQNVMLESKVKERTFELETSNTNLKETQSQLVNAEKMASLGQLTAGIAHEINNPLNFVMANIKPLKNDVDDIFSLLTKYGDIKNADNLEEKLKEINDFKEKNDTNYLFTEINKLLKGIDDGAYRTAEIVKGLKVFSHLGETDLKQTNIIEGLDSTLVILNSNINSGKIKVVKEYDPKFPEIYCLGGQINQVFMNILNNSIHALAEKKDGKQENIIAIKTYSENNNAIIRIKDNGCGIPDKIKDKIFDPFFSTKAVGSGTGLGLSIVYNIIKSHNGAIIVESGQGKGTEFIIYLPISKS